MLKLLWKRGEIAPGGAISPLIHNILFLMLEFMLNRDQIFSSR